MLFHAGALWRLNEASLLPELDRISSVSGGSITAGVLALHWGSLDFDHGSQTARQLVSQVIEPIRRLAGKTIDAGSILGGVLSPFSTIGDKVAAAYSKHLFGDATLQDLPDAPRFVFNATNVQSGALWRFMKPYMRDYRVGEVKAPTVPLAVAVAASAAFPPVLSPVRLELAPPSFTPGSGLDLQREPFTSDVWLSDGGVYDNLGLETAWKRFETVLVSDGGGKMEPQAEPDSDWARHSIRVLDLIDNQVRSLRKRQLIDSYVARLRKGAYWGIRTHVADYGLADPLDCPSEKTAALAGIPTRLKRLEPDVQERLINWGYAVCDAALRKHVQTDLPRPKGFPYPGVGVG
jgi:NTE family protein